MKYLKTEFLIIIFLWLNIIFSLIYLQGAGLFMIIGVIGLTIVSVLYFWKNKLTIIILALLLGIGIINLISFNDALQISVMGIFNIVNFLLFSILLYKKWDIFSELNEEWFGTSKEVYIEQRKKRIKFFRKRFEDLSTEELKSKMNENLVDEAKKAITEIIMERHR